MKKILFFVDGFAPTGEDMKAASKIDGQVYFRNVQVFSENEPLEDCDGVAGIVPTLYADKFATVKPAKASKAEASE